MNCPLDNLHMAMVWSNNPDAKYFLLGEEAILATESL